MSYSVKNYTESGGEVTHIGGKLIFEEGATIEGFPPSDGTHAVAAENQPNSAATTIAALKDDFNALLAKLKVAGLMTADVE